MRASRLRILLASTLAGGVGVLAWSNASRSRPGVSLHLAGYVTRRKETTSKGWRDAAGLRALIVITNGTGRSLMYEEPDQETSHFFRTSDGILVHGSRIPFTITLEPAQSTNFTVWIGSSLSPTECVLSYFQPSPVDPFFGFVPAPLGRALSLGRLWDWLHPKRTVSIMIPRPGTGEGH